MSSYAIRKREPSAKCTLVIDHFTNFNTATTKLEWFHSSNAKFGLCMNPYINMQDNNCWLSTNASFCIYMASAPNDGKIMVQYRMSIVNRKGQKCNTQEGKIRYSKNHQYRGQYILSRDDILDAASGWLVNDKLTIYCELYIIDSDLDEIPYPDESIKQSTIVQDYGSLLESGKLSDAVLVAGGTEFKVHKLILSARSAVFGAMFEHDTKEKQENRIEIENESAETYHELLRYIYTDKVDKIEENAFELMAAADKYQLEHLKSLCEQYLCTNLAIESVVATLVMADLHRSEVLKSKCFEYISRNVRKVKATEGWKTLTTKIELLTELVLHLSDNYN